MYPRNSKNWTSHITKICESHGDSVCIAAAGWGPCRCYLIACGRRSTYPDATTSALDTSYLEQRKNQFLFSTRQIQAHSNHSKQEFFYRAFLGWLDCVPSKETALNLLDGTAQLAIFYFAWIQRDKFPIPHRVNRRRRGLFEESHPQGYCSEREGGVGR